MHALSSKMNILQLFFINVESKHQLTRTEIIYFLGENSFFTNFKMKLEKKIYAVKTANFRFLFKKQSTIFRYL